MVPFVQGPLLVSVPWAVAGIGRAV